MVVYVCVGSSCHLKGSYDIITMMQKALKEHKIEDQVELKAAFCLGRCANGITMKVDDEIITGVSRENFPEKFNKYILGKLK